MNKAIRFVLTNLTATYRYGGNVISTVVVNHGDTQTNQFILKINFHTFLFLFVYYNQQAHNYESTTVSLCSLLWYIMLW
jgi:hypothetical protein